MGYDPGASGVLTLDWAELDILVTKTMEERLHKRYTEFGRQARLLGGVLPMNTTPYEERGIVKTYKKLPAAGGANMGQIGADTALPSPQTRPTYTNIWVNKHHIHDFEFPFEISRRIQRLLKSGRDGWGNALAMLEQEVMDQQMYLWDLLMLLNRHAIIGAVINDVGSSGVTEVAATFLADPDLYIYKDTTNKLLVFDIQCSWNTVRLGIMKGRLLQACAVPSAITSAITTLRNYTTWIKVLSDPEPSWDGTYCYQIRCAVPYTDANYDALATQIGNIAAADVLVPWAEATTGVSDLPIGGPNYGFPGWRFWSETNGSGVFADIEDATGAVTVALKTDEDTQRSVDRNAVSQEWDMLNPLISEGAAAAVSASTFTALDTLIARLAMKHTNILGVAMIANSVINKKMQDTLGLTTFTQNLDASDLKSRLAGRYGIATWSYDSLFLGQPVVAMSNDDIAPDQIAVVVVSDDEKDPGPLFEVISPDQGFWEVPPSEMLRGINSAGRHTHKKICVRAVSGTPFVRAGLDDRLGVLRNIKPA